MQTPLDYTEGGGIVTLTMNPTIDAGFEVQHLHDTHKMRTLAERYAPGGGGINVARVFVRLGGKSSASFTLSPKPTRPEIRPPSSCLRGKPLRGRTY